MAQNTGDDLDAIFGGPPSAAAGPPAAASGGGEAAAREAKKAKKKKKATKKAKKKEKRKEKKKARTPEERSAAEIARRQARKPRRNKRRDLKIFDDESVQLGRLSPKMTGFADQNMFSEGGAQNFAGATKARRSLGSKLSREVSTSASAASAETQATSSQLFQAVLLVTLGHKGDLVEGRSAPGLQPKISQCYPRAALADLPSRIETFCFPDVETLYPTVRSAATYFTFVLTQTDGSRTYGFCRRYLSTNGRPQQHRHDCGLRLPECLCVVSRYPYFALFDYFLKTLQILRWLDPTAMAPLLKDALKCPLTQQGGSYRVHKRHIFTVPMGADSRVPLTSSGVRTFFSRFAPSLLRHIIGAILCERRVIFHSHHIGIISRCIYTALALIYPFEWQHILVPLLPRGLLEYACAPSRTSWEFIPPMCRK